MRWVLLKWHVSEMSWFLCAWMDYDELDLEREKIGFKG